MICAAVMAAAVPAGAAEWISLSDWAYTEVSGFVSEGLLPEKLDNVYDYTRPITRGEFTELLYSVLDSTARLGEQREFGRFIDCEDYPSVNSLDVYIYEGLACDSSKFLPEQALTREEAALILYNTMHRLGLMGFLDEPDPSLLGALISDAASVSGYAAKAVYIMVSGGFMTGAGSFEPQAAMTIEQAELITNMQAVFYPNLAPSVAEQYIYRLDINGNTLTDSHFIKEVRPETMAFEDGFIIGESKMYIRTFVAENGSKSESTKYAYYLYDTRITASGVEKNAVGDIPATGICFDPACTRIYFMDADEIYNNGDSPIYVYDGETVTELSPGLRAESFGYLYDTGGVNVDKFGYLTKDDIGGDTYHVLDLTDGSISEARLVENVAAEYGDIPQGSSGVTEEGPVVMITADGVNISIDGETKLIEGVRDLYTIGDYVYLYEDEGRYGYGITTNMRPVTRRTLMAYNYKTGELIEISSDFSDSVWSFEDKFIYLTDSGQYKVVIGTECRSTAPNGGCSAMVSRL